MFRKPVKVTEIEIEGQHLRGAVLRAEDRPRQPALQLRGHASTPPIASSWTTTRMTSLESKVARLAPATMYSRLLAGRPSVAA